MGMGQTSLSITRYPVVPLSVNVGIVGWVHRTDTLHALIKAHRKARDVPLNVSFARIGFAVFACLVSAARVHCVVCLASLTVNGAHCAGGVQPFGSVSPVDSGQKRFVCQTPPAAAARNI